MPGMLSCYTTVDMKMKLLKSILVLITMMGLLLSGCRGEVTTREEPRPEPTPEPSPTQMTEPKEGLFTRTEAAQVELLKADRKEDDAIPLNAAIVALDAALRAEITAYLNAHLDPTRPLASQTTALGALRAALPNAGDDCTLLPLDLDGDESDELVVWNCANMPVGLLFTMGKDGYTAQPLPVPENVVWVWPQLWFGSLDAQDVTGDDRPELLLSYILPGGSMTTEKFYVLAWDGLDFQTRFFAELIDWVGSSTWELQPSPAGGQDIVLRYRDFYRTGFEAKMIYHPWATQRWRWDPSLERYALRETKRDPESVLSVGEDVPEWELLRVLVNEAELLYQAGDLEEALAGYQNVVARAADVERPEGRAPHWPAYARFRAAQVQALLGHADAAREELRALLADLDEGSNLRPLVQVFYAAYDPTQPDAALRAVAALHGMRLYEQFYWHDDRPGDLTFPMTMEPLLWPGTPLARYLDAHPEAVNGLPSSEREQTLLHTLSEMGFPVADVRIADLNDDGLLEVLVTTDETDQPNGRRSIWLLAQTGGRWHNHRPPKATFSLTEELTEKPLPDGQIVLHWEGSAFVWTGQDLVEVNPETYEPLPPWPRVGCL